MVVLQTISTQKRTYYMCIFAVKVHVVRELASMIRFGIAGSDQQSIISISSTGFPPPALE